MNKSQLERMAKVETLSPEKKTARARKTPLQATDGTRGAIIPNSATDASERLLCRFYAHLLGGANFAHTLSGEVDVCRTALRRARIALKVWAESREEI